ncbi:nuclear transport factor 2 family protein [Pediococcus ethanolidurans]|uniref:nuclear transport factor 2 family protein n=1 Tax=Pediococcus ethanolidurans TaxID=319653 RepID=UPI001C1EA61F|nr:nuclear transport factor 2 family protein [Pediococcus ethanolidurans]MBU7555124.1 nuclear transport factor 2 family protein [Pediococcus ethanolidurans]MCV3315785.1 nuclear transport factor 2 family protein [Pediococcus ethanolidurans]MCV3321649.1 nuclear transport factor 2 family protein [Pediococcus ethanolidurans]MCV3323999.1 nuclear transport factor 2 family protein [Pediococcus ethanolidurans]MCV3328161.1 nuclear transport factor 2 family protein [Pediococcus ethanolidurans]
MNKKTIIAEYFQMWVKKDFKQLPEIFSSDICYTECYGPRYVGLPEVQAWIRHKSAEQTVLEWRIDNITLAGDQSFVKWFFKAHEKTTYEFDGISVIQWAKNNQILRIDEYQSKSEHIRPYQNS